MTSTATTCPAATQPVAPAAMNTARAGPRKARRRPRARGMVPGFIASRGLSYDRWDIDGRRRHVRKARRDRGPRPVEARRGTRDDPGGSSPVSRRSTASRDSSRSSMRRIVARAPSYSGRRRKEQTRRSVNSRRFAKRPSAGWAGQSGLRISSRHRSSRYSQASAPSTRKQMRGRFWPRISPRSRTGSNRANKG
jgi:hypothetical protein